MREFIQSIVTSAMIHCPPKYSDFALKRAMEYGYAKGIQNAHHEFTGPRIGMHIVISGSGTDIFGTDIFGTDTLFEENSKPIYTSLDGSEVYRSPEELFMNLGDADPEQISVGIMTILEHAKERGLELREVERLRKAHALITHLGVPASAFCDRGQEVIANMNKLIAHYENEYRENTTRASE